MKKRGRLEIIKDILKTMQESRNSIRYTPLLRKSNMSTSKFNEYYSELIRKGLIIETKSSAGEKRLSLTQKGFNFLEKYKTIISFIEEFEL
ncbi:MAG TPA: winged helix-turn-helix domain-containing protein [Candidatus Pacearchaeota archaeon]|nr:winged helix-turn-helix domain-containing protein [Candidatus Pacearchaeota archaeon]